MSNTSRSGTSKTEKAAIDAEIADIDRQLEQLQGGKNPQAVFDHGKFRPIKNHSLEMVSMDKAEEKKPDWLITDYIF